MAFPRKILGIPIGWKDLGEIEGNWAGNGLGRYVVHKLCNSNAHIGKESQEIFKFCPRCLVKLAESNK